jgi:hypothetical protein
MLVNRWMRDQPKGRDRDQHDLHGLLFQHSARLTEQLDSIVKSDDLQAILQKLRADGTLDPDSVAMLNDKITRRMKDLAAQKGRERTSHSSMRSCSGR